MIPLPLNILEIIGAILAIAYLLVLMFGLCVAAAPRTPQERRYEDEEQMRELSTRRRH